MCGRLCSAGHVCSGIDCVWCACLCDHACMAGQFLSKHVAVKQVEGKTFRLQRSSSVTTRTVTDEDLRGRNCPAIPMP